MKKLIYITMFSIAYTVSLGASSSYDETVGPSMPESSTSSDSMLPSTQAPESYVVTVNNARSTIPVQIIVEGGVVVPVTDDPQN